MRGFICVLGIWQGSILLFNVLGSLDYKFWLHTGAPTLICLLAYMLEEKE